MLALQLKNNKVVEVDTDSSQNPICRICLSSSGNLVPAPCNCLGTVGYLHKRCWGRWMASVKNFDTCEICHQRYKKGTVIWKRSFKKLFMTFFGRPFYALCKFSVNVSLAAGIGYVLSCKLPVIFKLLNLLDVNVESTTGSNILLPLFIASPFIAAYCKVVEWTAVSLQDFTSSLWDWWHYSLITVQMSNESIDSMNNLSTTHSDDDDDLPMLNLSVIV